MIYGCFQFLHEENGNFTHKHYHIKVYSYNPKSVIKNDFNPSIVFLNNNSFRVLWILLSFVEMVDSNIDEMNDSKETFFLDFLIEALFEIDWLEVYSCTFANMYDVDMRSCMLLYKPNKKLQDKL